MTLARLFLTLFFLAILDCPSFSQQTLPGTKPLESKQDLAMEMVDGIDRYLMKQLQAAPKKREKMWQSAVKANSLEEVIEKKRAKLAKSLGLASERFAPKAPEILATLGEPIVIYGNDNCEVFAVRWRALPGINAEGLLLKPRGKIRARVVAIPDADETPEMIAGLADGSTHAFARNLVENGCLVLIPTIIDRSDEWSGNPKIRMTNQPHREFIYRMSYEMGRHIIGYELEKVFAAIDWFANCKEDLPIGVIGHGEGGLLALYSGAIDPRIKSVAISGYFQPRESLWKEPIYRNVWGFLKEFGDAELAVMVAPRSLIVEDHPGPMVAGPPQARAGRAGAATGGTNHFDRASCHAEVSRAKDFLDSLGQKSDSIGLVKSDGAKAGTNAWVNGFLGGLGFAKVEFPNESETWKDQRKDFSAKDRLHRQFNEFVDYTQNLFPTAVNRRNVYWKTMDTTNLPSWQKSTAPFRKSFARDIIGELPTPKKDLQPRTRLLYETKKWKGYEVVLDLYDDVICYGILLVPNDIKPGEKRPVVVCQHGLEGRPQDVCNPNQRTRAYNSFGAQLAENGYIVFAPQNPYIGHEKFRVLIRKGHPLNLSLYSFIVAQHERIIDWLETLPMVDKDKIAFYGLSYGGKVAMRIGALVDRYCLVICSGDFNEWIWKNINLVWAGSYMFTVEYDMYEFNLANTFNYAEMARLIAPRPFMVERGHSDGVGLDEWVAHEYARVRYIYAKLGIPTKTEIEFFTGGHEIHGVGTFRFLQKHLGWPAN